MPRKQTSEQVRTQTAILFRTDSSVREKIRVAAAMEGLSQSQWLERVALEAAEKVVEKFRKKS